MPSMFYLTERRQRCLVKIRRAPKVPFNVPSRRPPIPLQDKTSWHTSAVLTGSVTSCDWTPPVTTPSSDDLWDPTGGGQDGNQGAVSAWNIPAQRR